MMGVVVECVCVCVCIWGVGGTDEVVMATPHWHAPDWSMWWLIIQCICLKKNNKVGRIEMQSRASCCV